MLPLDPEATIAAKQYLPPSAFLTPGGGRAGRRTVCDLQPEAQALVQRVAHRFPVPLGIELPVRLRIGHPLRVRAPAESHRHPERHP